VEGRPLVSVVLATYNWSSVLRHAVRSVLWQTYSNFELLVVGDACTDDSEEVVASFGDDRVRWQNLATNTGSQSTPNNTGIGLARGEYIAYQGHDDVWHPLHLATLLTHLRDTGADFAYSMAEVLGPPGSRQRSLSGPRLPDLGKHLYWLPPTSIVHRSELTRRMGGWRTWEEAGRPPDSDFVLRTIDSGARMIRVEALTTFKFPSALRPNSYRERPSHEQESYVRRMERNRLFLQREFAALALRRLSPLKERPAVEWLPEADRADAKTHYSHLRRVRGLD
jgi:glycosyltransferase involved in cell wall biosynthesis